MTEKPLFNDLYHLSLICLMIILFVVSFVCDKFIFGRNPQHGFKPFDYSDEANFYI